MNATTATSKTGRSKATSGAAGSKTAPERPGTDRPGFDAKRPADSIAADLRDQITSGQLPPASVLPSERKLAELYGVARLTVQHAIGQLKSEGIVQAIHGKGVFVRRAGDWPSQTHTRTITVDGAGNYADSESAAGEWEDIETPTKYHTNAEGQLAAAFGVPQGTSFFASDRLLQNRAGTRIFVRTYLPVFVTKELRKLARASYISARKTYDAARAAGMQLDFNDYIIARNPTPDDANTLRIPNGIPMLITRRIATHDNKPIIMQETHRSAEDTQLHYRPRT